MSKNVRYALTILVFVLAWLFSGFVFRNDNASENTADATSQENKIFRVQVRDINQQRFAPSLTVSARTEAFRMVELRAETSGQLESTPVTEGSDVKAGDELARLRVDDRNFRVREAEASLAQATLDYQGTLKLLDKELVSEIQVARAKASVDSALANLEFRKLELAKTRLVAPFDAVLNERKLEVGSYLQLGQAYAELLQLDPIKAVAQVSGDEVLDLKKGAPVQLELSNGAMLDGELGYVSVRADAATRAFIVEAFFDNPGNKVPADLTGNLKIRRAEAVAHQIPASIVTLNANGDLEVKWVGSDHIVQASVILILHDDRSSLWVSGLPDSVRIITVGQEYVSVGETVDPVYSSSADPE